MKPTESIHLISSKKNPRIDTYGLRLLQFLKMDIFIFIDQSCQRDFYAGQGFFSLILTLLDLFHLNRKAFFAKRGFGDLVKEIDREQCGKGDQSKFGRPQFSIRTDASGDDEDHAQADEDDDRGFDRSRGRRKFFIRLKKRGLCGISRPRRLARGASPTQRREGACECPSIPGSADVPCCALSSAWRAPAQAALRNGNHRFSLRPFCIGRALDRRSGPPRWRLVSSHLPSQRQRRDLSTLTHFIPEPRSSTPERWG